MAAVDERTRQFDAENAVIGSMLRDETIVPRLLARVDAADFSSEKNKRIFQAARALFRDGRPVDPITIRDAAGQEYSAVMAQLMELTPTSANWEAYADAMHEQAALARIQAQALLLTGAATLDDCREPVRALGEELGAGRRIESWTLSELLTDFAQRQGEQKPKEYIRYGLAPLDSGTYTQRGDVVMIGGAPSDGKTAFALVTAYHMAKTWNVGFFSLETGREKLEDRLVASGFRIDLAAIKKNALGEDDWDRFAHGLVDASERKLRILRASGLSVEQIAAASKAYGFDAIFIDYAQLIEPERARGASRAEQMAQVSRDLHTFAQTSGTLVVELAQLSRQDRKDKRERDMFDLGESSQFEKDADLILLLYRPKEDNKDGLDPDTTRILNVAKNKEGVRGRWPLYFDGAHQSFSVLADAAGRAVMREMSAAGRAAKANRSGIYGQQKIEELPPEAEEGMPF